MNPFYTDYSEYLHGIFPGRKVQKLSVDAGMTCPNRDGSLSTGGCIYCDNRTFAPGYTRQHESVVAQIAAGREFFARKYPTMEYLAYFQAYTNTYAPVNRLRALYEEALAQPGVAGIIIGTRPDCMPQPVVDLLTDLSESTEVFVEIGAETCSDATLEAINRHHTWGDVEDAVSRLKSAGVHVGLHLIAGLPLETRDDMLRSVRAACDLGIDSLKMHQMQVIAGTELHRRFLAGTSGVTPWQLDDYLDLCADIVDIVPRTIAIERFVAQAPADMLVAPCWGLKNHEFTDRLHALLRRRHPASL